MAQTTRCETSGPAFQLSESNFKEEEWRKRVERKRAARSGSSRPTGSGGAQQWHPLFFFSGTDHSQQEHSEHRSVTSELTCQAAEASR